jgi:toxin YoeB
VRIILFEPLSHKQFLEWEQSDKKIFQKIVRLLAETQDNPFTGTGKPELLKYQLESCWSRRINREHRLVYKVTDDAIFVVSCKYHY